MKAAFYFGCLDSNDSAGHRFHGSGRFVRKPGSFGEVPEDCPWTIRHADTGLLKNGNHPDVIDGRVWRTCGKTSLDHWHAFVWWDRTGDSRPNSNSGFYVRGIISYMDAFVFAITEWPMIAQRQPKPWPLLQP